MDGSAWSSSPSAVKSPKHRRDAIAGIDAKLGSLRVKKMQIESDMKALERARNILEKPA